MFLVCVKAYAAWCNSFLSVRGLKVSRLAADLSDGVLLIHLLEISFGGSVGKYTPVPKQLAQKIANVATAFFFLKKHGTPQ